MRTRAWGQSGPDGWFVRFSDLDRPFFIEPAPCDIGTQVTLELNADLSRTDYQDALRDLFVYLPPFVTVLPARSAPTSLEAASVFESHNIRPSSTTHVQRIDRIRVGTAPAVIKTELYSRDKPKGKQQSTGGTNVPQTSLTIAINGILVFTQSGLLLNANGKPFTETLGHREDRHLGLAGCHVTIDFEPENAPILPSRDALDPDAFSVSDVSHEILRQAAMLIPELALTAARRAPEHKQAKRTAVLEALESIVKPEYPYPWERGDIDYHRSDLILKKAASTYAETCPLLVVDTLADRTSHVLLDELEDDKITTVVLSTVTNASAFSLYTRSRGMTSWIEVTSKKELALLQQAWPHGKSPETINSTDKLFEDYGSVFAEVRDSPTFAILRGDYALSKSPLFGDSLFFRLPPKAAQIKQPEGVDTRRGSLTSSPTPRIVLNAEHPLILALDDFLARCTEDERDQVHTLFNYVCDSVIDVRAKRAPETRWRVLRVKLERLTGADLRDIPFRNLELSL